jgi:hypothetical protein
VAGRCLLDAAASADGMAEHDTDASEQEHESAVITFPAFVLSLAHTAAVHFGDVPDPMSGEKVAPNLPAARQMIQILALLEQKTRGNLSAEERQLLDQILYELRMRYDEAGAGAGESSSRIIIP